MARPAIEALMRSIGVPLDLSALGRDLPPATRRAALELPLKIDASRSSRSCSALTSSSAPPTTRTGRASWAEEPYQVAKLVQRRTLASTIPRDQWRRPLTTRFERAGLSIGPVLLEEVLDFGAERPYDTMTAGRYVALTARKLKLEVVDQQCIAEGLREAREHLDEDD